MGVDVLVIISEATSTGPLAPTAIDPVPPGPVAKSLHATLPVQ